VADQQSGKSDYNALARRLADQGPEAVSKFLDSLDGALQEEAGIGLAELVDAWASEQQQGQEQQQAPQGGGGADMAGMNEEAPIEAPMPQGRQRLSLR
jgi:hypothetical protein